LTNGFSKMKRLMQCPCKSGQFYKECCQKYHLGKPAESALSLMRSRYSAYSLGLAEYIIQTTHPLHPNYNLDFTQWKKEILQFSSQTTFQDLKIIEFIDGELEAFVTFKAELIQSNKDASFIEKSYFLFVNHKWLYRDGNFSSLSA